MRWSDVGKQPCSVARALSVVGDPWTLVILREAFLGARRFDEFRQRVGAARPIVAARLAGLVASGVLERRRYQDRPPRDEYVLTEKGRDLMPVMMALVAWGDRWLDDGRGRPVDFVHDACGQRTTAVATCSECGEPLEPEQLRAGPGPGAGRAFRRRHAAG